MDELLSLHARDDVNGVVVLVFCVPFRQVLQPFEEEGRLHVLEEVDAREIGYGGRGDVEGRGAVWGRAAGSGGDGLGLAGEDERGRGGEKEGYGENS